MLFDNINLHLKNIPNEKTMTAATLLSMMKNTGILFPAAVLSKMPLRLPLQEQLDLPVLIAVIAIQTILSI